MGRRQFAKNQDVRRFRLVARSQNDAHAKDAEATPLVLEPFAKASEMRKTGLSEAELTALPESLAKHAVAFADPDGCADGDDFLEGDSSEDGEFDEEDLEGDCYFPKDGYNYEQHLVAASKTKVGVVMEAPEILVTTEELKVAAPRQDEEKDVDRCLDFAEEYDEFDDDELDEFMGGGVAEEGYTMLWGAAAEEDKDMPDLAAFKAMHARMIGAANFTETEDEAGSEDGAGAGSALPSRARAHSDAEAAAAEFEEFFAAEYGEEDDVGELEDEEIEGDVALDEIEGTLDEYIESKRAEQEKFRSISEPQPRRGPERVDDVPRVIEETRAIIERHYQIEEDEDGEDTESGEESDSESRTWDCESVLSTLSNVSNRPGKIGKIKVIKKPAPAPMKTVQEQEENEEDSEDDVVELPDVSTERPKNETAEEKKQRKAAVKEMRRICRKMKKESKETFKNEAAKLPANKANNGDVRQFGVRKFRL